MIPTSVVFIIRIPSVKTEMACVNFATYKKKKKNPFGTKMDNTVYFNNAWTCIQIIIVIRFICLFIHKKLRHLQTEASKKNVTFLILKDVK